MPNLSQIFTNGQVLQAKAGPLAIAQNDVVALGGVPPARLYPVKTSDYAAVSNAGSAAVALTTVSSAATQLETRKRAIVDPATGDIFFADTYLTGPVGCQIWKYNSAGVLQRQLILDSTSTGSTNYVQTMFLSNGNILVFWYNVGAPYTLFFAIVDKNLTVVVAKTTIASVSANPPARADCIALSGGGFAIAYALAGGQSYFTIRNNAGAVVYGPTIITGSPTNSSGNANGPHFKLAQLSDGNIFVGINDNAQSDAGRYCIFTTSGDVVRAYTTLTGYGAGGSAYPEIDTLASGGVCMAIPGLRAFVFNNAGVLQGTPVTMAGSVARVANDGTYFYTFHLSSGLVVTRYTTSGVTVANTLSTVTGLQADVLLGQGYWLVFDATNCNVISIDATGFPSLLATATFSGMLQTIGGLGDFCALGVQVGKFQITKYLAASIIGVAQTAVAAGNAGSQVTINEGPGGYITNEIKGTVGKVYDHSSATIVGNKGALYLNSATFKGI